MLSESKKQLLSLRISLSDPAGRSAWEVQFFFPPHWDASEPAREKREDAHQDNNADISDVNRGHAHFCPRQGRIDPLTAQKQTRMQRRQSQRTRICARR